MLGRASFLSPRSVVLDHPAATPMVLAGCACDAAAAREESVGAAVVLQAALRRALARH